MGFFTSLTLLLRGCQMCMQMTQDCILLLLSRFQGLAVSMCNCCSQRLRPFLQEQSKLCVLFEDPCLWLIAPRVFCSCWQLPTDQIDKEVLTIYRFFLFTLSSARQVDARSMLQTNFTTLALTENNRIC